MNKNAISTFWTTTAIALASSVLFSEPSSANTIEFTCNSSDTIVATAIDENGKSDSVEILSFPSEYFSSSTQAQQNCQETATTLESDYNNDSLGFLYSGFVDGDPALCMVPELGDTCSSSNTLFNLKQNADPKKALYDMLGSGFKGDEETFLTAGDSYASIDRGLLSWLF